MTGLDNLTGPVPSLDDHDLGRLLRALAAGTPVAACARAFGVTRRTVYRYRGARLERVQVGNHELVFVVYADGRPPVQVSQRRHPRINA